jgi:acetylornithine deacetylase
MIDETFITKTLIDLVGINSVNPNLESYGAGEEEIGLYIDRLLQSFGIETELVLLVPKRVNVIGIINGSGEGRSLMLNAHTDTVGIESMDNPFSAEIKGGKLYGRGAYDMKGSIAAILGVAKAITDHGIKLPGDLILSFVADEEYESIGAQDLVKYYKTDSAIVTEPTDLNVCIAHRGFGIYEVKTQGKIAHGGCHQEGIDANTKMGLFLVELEKLAKKLPDEKFHPLCGHASLHVPLIHGGQSLFIYSGGCTIQVERRTLPGEIEMNVLEELQEIIDILAERDRNFHATVKPLIWRSPYEISPDVQIVSTVKKSARRVLGYNPSYIGHTWWEDSAIIGKNGTDVVIIGPKGGGIHQETEWVEVKSVVDLSTILLETVFDYCR